MRFTIERGDRVALVGVNGAGKSTLIKLLTGDEAPTAGTVKLGHNVVSEYFAQDQYKVLDGEARMLDDISRAALKVPEVELRSLLGCFLFSGDDVFKPLGVLSGGERNRYALARILVSPSNFLLLDEPTNHLDMRAKDVLLEALAALQRHGGLCLARSLLHRPAGHARARSGERRGHSLRGQLRGLSAPQGGAGRGSPADGHPERRHAQHASRRTCIPFEPKQRLARNGLRTRRQPPSSSKAVSSRADGAAPKKQTRRLNPIKQKQMEERCGFLKKKFRASRHRSRTPRSNWASMFPQRRPQRLTTLAEDLRAQLRALTAEWEELMAQLEA